MILERSLIVTVALACTVMGYLLSTLFSLGSLTSGAFLLAALAFGITLGILLNWFLDHLQIGQRPINPEWPSRTRDTVVPTSSLQPMPSVAKTKRLEHIQIERIRQHQTMATSPVDQPLDMQALLNQSTQNEVIRLLVDFLRERDAELKVLRNRLEMLTQQHHQDRNIARQQLQLAHRQTQQQIATMRAEMAKTAAEAQTEAEQRLQAMHQAASEQIQVERAEAKRELNRLRRRFQNYVKSHPDDFTVIKGIGPVYQRKLNDLGIVSYKQLSRANPEQLRRLLYIAPWQKVDPANWVAQSRDWI